jgi:Ner family transcriptional regulator
MNPYEIVYSLKKLGKSQKSIAETLQIKAGVVSNVIHGRITSYHVASHIASLLGKSVTDLWPDRYVFRPRGRNRAKRPQETT